MEQPGEVQPELDPHLPKRLCLHRAPLPTQVRPDLGALGIPGPPTHPIQACPRHWVNTARSSSLLASLSIPCLRPLNSTFITRDLWGAHLDHVFPVHGHQALHLPLPYPTSPLATPTHPCPAQDPSTRLSPSVSSAWSNPSPPFSQSLGLNSIFLTLNLHR